MFVLLRAPHSLCLKEPMHEKAGRTIPSPILKSGEAHGTQRRPEASDLMPSPSLHSPIPHQNITRERTRPQLIQINSILLFQLNTSSGKPFQLIILLTSSFEFAFTCRFLILNFEFTFCLGHLICSKPCTRKILPPGIHG